MAVLPRVSSCLDSASSVSVRTTILPAEMPEGAVTRIMSPPTCSKLVTETPSGKMISRTSAKPEPLMVIGWPGTTFVGKNTLMFSPASAVSSISLGLHAVKAPRRTTASIIPK